MTIKHVTLSLTLTLLSAVGGSCASGTPSTADAAKAILPHPSWTCGMPEGIPTPESGTAVFEAQMKLDRVDDVGKTPYGRRQVFVGQGTVTGAKIQGTVQPGGLDFQLTLSNGVVEVEQVMVIKTSDGKYLYLRNAGTGVNAADVRVVMDFEAPNNSPSAWLNTGKYVARRTVDLAAKTLKLTVYEVSDAAARIDAAQAVRISKPADVPPQPWDYRKASPSEARGEAFITEVVTLGGSTSVGASKRGNRNIIPITGGTLTGTLTGKVVPGGADFQNFSNGPAIDARYLWQADDGEIIIVRNTGPMGSLIPTFEARVDGKYAWLNGGTYMSSNPGMGAGGVSLTMYKSDKK